MNHLIVLGRSARWIAAANSVLFLAALASFGVGGGFAVLLFNPRSFVSIHLGPTYGSLAAIALVVALPAAIAILGKRWIAARAGYCLLDPSGIRLSKHGEGEGVVAWAAIESYDDRSADFVQLVRKGQLVSSGILTIPTIDEATRTSVLAFLDARGIPRREA